MTLTSELATNLKLFYYADHFRIFEKLKVKGLTMIYGQCHDIKCLKADVNFGCPELPAHLRRLLRASEARVLKHTSSNRGSGDLFNV